MACGHCVPCICPDYLDRLSLDQLENLRAQFGKVVIGWGNKKRSWLDVRADRSNKKKLVKAVNKVLEEKFGITIV